MSFIYYFTLEESQSLEFQTVICHVYYADNKWNVEKIYEEKRELNHLNWLTVKGKKVTLIRRELIIKRDQETGKVIVEPFVYKDIYDKNNDWIVRVIGEGYMGDIIDEDGKIHILTVEGSDEVRKLYYYVYNPASETPDKPEIREHIETRKW